MEQQIKSLEIQNVHSIWLFSTAVDPAIPFEVIANQMEKLKMPCFRHDKYLDQLH